MLHCLLIANRGEIACRIIKTARQLGIRTVAVYSSADAGARHVGLADEAWLIGGPAPRDSYLNAAKILEVAHGCGADAIHPGYGFLSENEDFAAAVQAAGLIFVGPPAAAIAAMGDKAASKRLMQAAGVPLVPGYHDEAQDLPTLQAAADAIGYPVLIKASAGGGGKGMKVAERSDEFASQLASAQREALAAFGDQRVLIEKYLQKPRHIEIQVFADQHGNCLHLFERDCSVQRRHQKVAEEAPAPGLSSARREAMGAAAVAAARAVHYQGAGTVEFIVDTASGDFYFMEMNTRLQVEHPVTEMITGLDLVAWQLLVANGQPLPKTQQQLAIDGHAFEVRLYAEDPANDFLPVVGTLRHLQFPVESAHVRIDSGVVSGDQISPHYDPMLAKIIVWDRDRATALHRLQATLAITQVDGLTTNLDFLRNLAAHAAFRQAELDTGLIGRYRDELIPPPAAPSTMTLALAALAELASEEQQQLRAAQVEPNSPWFDSHGWRLNLGYQRQLHFRHAGGDSTLTAAYQHGRYRIQCGEIVFNASASLHEGRLSAELDGRRLSAQVVRHDNSLNLLWAGGSAQLQRFEPWQAALTVSEQRDDLNAPMPGTISAVLVQLGQAVRAGDALLVIEAMKMEHTITAPYAGTVSALFYQAGEQVAAAAPLLELKATEHS